MLTTTAQPDTRSSVLVDQDEQMQRSRDAYEGTDAVRRGRLTYNPQGARETDADYTKRLQISVVDGSYTAVVDTAVGLPFAKEPQLSTDTPDAIAELWENLDGRGTHGTVYWQERMEDAILDGFSLSVDDYTPIEADNARDEALAGARPYSVPYRKRDLLSFRTATMGGIATLTQVVLAESYSVQSGDFGEDAHTQLRRIWRDERGEVQWAVLRRAGDMGEWMVYRNGFMRGAGGAPLRRFPVRTLYGSRARRMFVARPSFLNIADLVLAHYQTWSDRRWGIRLGCNPIPTFTGVDPADLAGDQSAGPSRGVVLRDPAARFSFTAAPSDMMAPALDELRHIEGRIAAATFAHVAGAPRTNETAAAKRLDTAATDSTLASIVRRTADCIDESLAGIAEYIGSVEGTIGIDRDFRAPILLEPQMVGTLSTMVDRRQLTLSTLLTVLKTGRFPDNWDLEDEELNALAGAYVPLIGGGDPIQDAGSGGA